MKEYRILVAIHMEESQLREIAAVDPRLRVNTVAHEFGALTGRAPLGLRAPDEADLVDRTTAETRLAPLLQEVEILYTAWVLPDLLQRSPKLRWVHLFSHGVDYIRGDILEKDVIVTTGQGAHAAVLAEHVMTLVLMLAKQAPRFMRQQGECQWKRFYVIELSRSTLGLVGFGSIGKRVAQYAKSFGMRVIATRRTFTEESPLEIDELVPRDRLEYLLKESDFVVLALPLTSATRNLIGEKELRMMKPSAFLINISRGGLVDEPALIRALQEKQLAGAGLDVFQVEPLPAESPLWHMDGVIITPHVGPLSPYLVENANRLFMENLRRYITGNPLLNVFDRVRGY